MSKWDPIGVSDVPEAADEYDSYIDGVWSLLKNTASDDVIAEYLRKIETERMGLTDKNGNPLLPIEIRAATVAELQDLRSRFESATPSPSRKPFRHWKLFTKHISPAFAKTGKRRELGVCIGCGSNPCRCKNPKSKRG